MIALGRVLSWFSQTLPVLLDVTGLAFVAFGVYLLETSTPGIWAVVVGVGLILSALRAQT
jgi:hypothetical protein